MSILEKQSLKNNNNMTPLQEAKDLEVGSLLNEAMANIPEFAEDLKKYLHTDLPNGNEAALDFLWKCYDEIPKFKELIYENIAPEDMWSDDDGGSEVEFQIVSDYFEYLMENAKE